jgi:hypothetical protein
METNNVGNRHQVLAQPTKKGGKTKKVTLTSRYGPGNANTVVA